MRREDTIAIVNPRSGGRRMQPEQLSRMADSVVMTQRPGHASLIAATASKYETILVAGGDGTLFEVLQAMNRQNQRLRILPSGRGNSLARDLNAEPRRIDLMEVSLEGYQYLCASTVAAGYPVSVAAAANRHFRSMGRYCYAAAGALTRPAAFHARVSYQQAPAKQLRLTGLIVNNTRHIANFLAFPRASAQDGWLDTMELRNGFFRQNLHNLSTLARWNYQPAPPGSAQTVHIEWDGPQTILLDGELFPGVSELNIRVLESALWCGLAA